MQEVAERTWAALEQARAEKAMRRSEAKYRLPFESMNQGHCIIRLLHEGPGPPVDWRFPAVNPAFEKQSGLRNAMGKTIRELAPGTEKKKWLAICRRVATTGGCRRFEETSVALNQVLDLYAFRVGEAGEDTIAGLCTDITARRHTEQQLQELTNKLSSWCCNAPGRCSKAATCGRPTSCSPASASWRRADRTSSAKRT